MSQESNSNSGNQDINDVSEGKAESDDENLTADVPTEPLELSDTDERKEEKKHKKKKDKRKVDDDQPTDIILQKKFKKTFIRKDDEEVPEFSPFSNTQNSFPRMQAYHTPETAFSAAVVQALTAVNHVPDQIAESRVKRLLKSFTGLEDIRQLNPIQIMAKVGWEGAIFILFSVMAGFAAYYYGPEALKAWQEIFKPLLHIDSDSPATDIPGYFMSACSAIVNAVLTKVTFDSMRNDFTSLHSAERAFLTHNLNETWQGWFARWGRIMVNMFFAIATIGFGFFLTAQDTTFLAGTLLFAWAGWVALTNLGPNYVGVASIENPLHKYSAIELARKTEAEYLDRCINYITQLASKDLAAAASKINKISNLLQRNTTYSTDEGTIAYAKILQLGNQNPANVTREKIANVAKIAGTIWVGASPLGYINDGGVGVYSLVSDITSEGASLTAAITFALISAVPICGLGAGAGGQVGYNLTAGNTSLAKALFPKIKLAILGLVCVIAGGSGGPNTKANVTIELIDTLPLPEPFKIGIKAILGFSGYTGAWITNLYFFGVFFDDLMIYLAKNFTKNPDVLKLITFVIEMRKLQGLVKEIAPDLYQQRLNNYLQQNSGDDEVGTILTAVFQQKLNDDQYEALQENCSDLENKPEGSSTRSKAGNCLTFFDCVKKPRVGYAPIADADVEVGETTGMGLSRSQQANAGHSSSSSSSTEATSGTAVSSSAAPETTGCCGNNSWFGGLRNILWSSESSSSGEEGEEVKVGGAWQPGYGTPGTGS